MRYIKARLEIGGLYDFINLSTAGISKNQNGRKISGDNYRYTLSPTDDIDPIVSPMRAKRMYGVVAIIFPSAAGAANVFSG